MTFQGVYFVVGVSYGSFDTNHVYFSPFTNNPNKFTFYLCVAADSFETARRETIHAFAAHDIQVPLIMGAYKASDKAENGQWTFSSAGKPFSLTPFES